MPGLTQETLILFFCVKSSANELNRDTLIRPNSLLRFAAPINSRKDKPEAVVCCTLRQALILVFTSSLILQIAETLILCSPSLSILLNNLGVVGALSLSLTLALHGSKRTQHLTSHFTHLSAYSYSGGNCRGWLLTTAKLFRLVGPGWLSLPGSGH